MKKLLLLLLLLSPFVKLSAQVTPIHDVQYISPSDLLLGNNLSYVDGDTVIIQGVCTFDPCHYAQSGSAGYPSRLGTWLEDVGGGPWSGIEVLIEPAAIGGTNSLANLQALDAATNFINNFSVGNVVQCKGIVKTFYDNTQINLLPVSSTIISVAAVPTPPIVTIDSLMLLNTGTSAMDPQLPSGEQWEGVYVQMNNVQVTATSTTSTAFHWSVKDGLGNTIAIKDNISGVLDNGTYDFYCSSASPQTTVTPTTFASIPSGTVLSYLRGIIFQSSNGATPPVYNYYIAPLTLADVGPTTFAPPVVTNVSRSIAAPTTSQTVDINAQVTDDSSVVAVELYYAFGLSTSTFSGPVTMSNTSGSNYMGTIPAASVDSTWVKYYIKATDNFGHVTYYPDINATNSFYLVLNSGINSIQDIQGNHYSNGVSIYVGDSTAMNITGTVMATAATNDLGYVTIQNGTAPYQGIFLKGVTGDGVDVLKRGDNIHITSAKVLEVSGTNNASTIGATTLTNLTYTVVSSNNTLYLPVTSLNQDSVIARKFNYTEPYEAMLVGLTNVTVVDTNPDRLQTPPKNFGEFSIYQNPTGPLPTTGIRCDDYSNDIFFGFNTDSLLNGDNLCFVNGIFRYDFGAWKILPRNLSDICGFNTAYPKTLNTFKVNSSGVDYFGIITQSTKTVAVSVPFGTNVTNLAATATYSGQSISPAAVSTQDFTNPVQYTITASDNSTAVYTVTVTVGPNGVSDVAFENSVEVYPNPVVNSTANLKFSAINAGVVKLSVTNVHGQVVYSSRVNTTQGLNTIQLPFNNLSAGNYILELNNGQSSVHKKITVADNK